MAAEVRVNGTTFKRFKQVDLSRSIDTFAGEVRIMVSQAPDNSSFIKIGDLIEIYLDGLKVFTGYIEKVTDSESKAAHDLSFRARDKVADLIDSNVPESVKALENVSSFSELVQLCIDGIGLTSEIEVVDNVGAEFGDSSKLKASSTGQTIGSFLQENARIVQVFLNSDGDGNVLIQVPDGKHKTILQNVPNARNNNIKTSNIDIDYSKRFYRYTFYSNSSLASDSATINDLNNKGESFDNEIRTTRVFEKIAEKPMTSGECKKCAEEEANIRRSRSFAYKCSVVGFSGNEELWTPGKDVTVKDSLKGMNGLFTVNKVTWSYSHGGEITTMDITLPDKLTVEANATPVTERTTLASSTYGVVSGDTLSQIAVNFNVKLSDLVAANPQIENIDLIYPDQQIKIPGGST